MRDPAATFAQGVSILEPLLSRHGFRFEAGASGPSSGGAFALGSFVRGDRRLELHFRHSLGLVSYSVAGLRLDHAEFIRAQQAAAGRNAYPGFSSDPLDAFRHLLHDLDCFGGAFLTGTDSSFEVLVRWVAEHPKPTGVRAT